MRGTREVAEQTPRSCVGCCRTIAGSRLRSSSAGALALASSEADKDQRCLESPRTVRRAKRKKLLARTKGFYQTKSKLYRAAKESADTAAKYAYVGRKNKKREYRRLWVVRINAAPVRTASRTRS